jgi:hypothetical protein
MPCRGILDLCIVVAVTLYHSVHNLPPTRLLSKYIIIRLFKTIIFPVFLHGCDTWSLILKETHRLRLFENGLLRMLEQKCDIVTGSWKKLQNEELLNLHSSSKYNESDQVKDEIGRACSTNESETRNAYKLWVTKASI